MVTPEASRDLLSLSLGTDWEFRAVVQPAIWGVLILIAVICFVARVIMRNGWTPFEIDQTEIGTGAGKVTLRPNWTDRQVAYSIWVELSTRKIGLEIDFEHDVMIEVLDSWYSFFGITRDLLKTIPVQKVRNKSTQQIIKISINVLNQQLRPVLTRWQARYRRWYEQQLNNPDCAAKPPQEIQLAFPEWREMTADITKVNERLIAYRGKLRALID